MTEPSAGPQFDIRGAVDLSSLGRPTVPPPGSPGGAPAASGAVVDVTDEGFQDLIERSRTVPVIVLLWIPADEANARLAADLDAVVRGLGGRLLLARVDVQTYPAIAAAFQAQGVPLVVAVLAGQPLPLFQGVADPEQIRSVLDQVLQAAEANGITGTVPLADGEEQSEAPEPEAAPLPPHHQAAYDAIERDDLDGAVTAYTQALKEDPRDALAVAGLAQVRLLQRTRDLDLAEVRRRAAEQPDDLSALFDVADLDLLGGHVEDAVSRLLERIASSSGEDREAIRTRLVEYFEILGPEDPRVPPARRALASALF